MSDFFDVLGDIGMINNDVRSLIQSWRWAVVSQVSPLRITMDGDTGPLADAPDTLVAGLAVGDRVRCVTVNRRTLILGRSGGAPAPAPTSAVYSLSKRTVAGSTYTTWSVTWPTPYAAAPTVIPGLSIGSHRIKGTVTVSGITTTGCTVRIDNLGSQSGSVSPTLLVSTLPISNI